MLINISNFYFNWYQSLTKLNVLAVVLHVGGNVNTQRNFNFRRYQIYMRVGMGVLKYLFLILFVHNVIFLSFIFITIQISILLSLNQFQDIFLYSVNLTQTLIY